MSLFEVMYGIKCNTPISWDDPMNIVVLRPNMLK